MSALFGNLFSANSEIGVPLAAARNPQSAIRDPQSAAPVSPSLARILRPQAAYRWLLPQLAAITPQYIEMILRGALAGNHVQQWELFDLMLDSWPELSACAQELTYGVSRLKLVFEPFCEEDEEPTDSAMERCKVVSSALRRMMPDAANDENDLEGTLKDIIDGWFRGVTCLEVDWQNVRTSAGPLTVPKSTYWVHPVCFAFDRNGRLGLRVDSRGELSPGTIGSTSAQPQPAVVGAFPPHKFLIGIHKAKSGTALGGSLLRPLAWWWCAANFSADWLLNLAQVFGLPFRWANYDPNAPQETVDRICDMLQNMGSAGWAAFPAGTTLELKDTAKTGDHSPQGELLDRADRYARLLVLGQTLSGSQDSSRGGGKAFGSVEADVKSDRIDAAGRYACRVLNTQLIPSILTLNYGDCDECPAVRLLEDEEGGLEEAQRDEILSRMMPLSSNFLRKKYGQPEPNDEEDSVGGAPEPEEEGDEDAAVFDPEKDIVTQRALWREKHKSETEPAMAALARIAEIDDDAVFARAMEDFAAGIAARDEDGVWRTIGGHPVFIRHGQTIEEALHHAHGGGKTIEKKRKSASTAGSKKDTIHERERSEKSTPSKPSKGAARDGAGHGSHAERTTRDELARAAGADTEGGLKGSYDRQTQALAALRESHAELAVEPSQERKIGEGAEHHVELHHADATRVMKHTTEGFGVVLHPQEAPFGAYAGLRKATPQEYIARMDAQNHLFGDDTRIEGITKAGDHIGLAVSQRAIKGGEPSPAELEKFMKSKGFVKVKADAFDNDYIQDKVWFHPQSNHVVADVKPDNFKKDSQGRIVPIDVLVHHAPAGSTLHRAVSANLAK